MDNRIELSVPEEQRLHRVLACNNLEKQKRFALILIGAAPITFLFALALGYFHGTLVLMVPFGIVMAGFVGTIGTARLGYYKLFRLIHAVYQAGERDEGT